ncbi:MAG: hypothetical protein U0838_07315 [Chloroflexota bacterium]
MTVSRRLEVLLAAADAGVLPPSSRLDAQRALAITAALREGGARVIEFTDRGPGAWTAFTALAADAARHDLDAILGAGSIRDAEAADRFIASGACFIVGPSLSPMWRAPPQPPHPVHPRLRHAHRDRHGRGIGRRAREALPGRHARPGLWSRRSSPAARHADRRDRRRRGHRGQRERVDRGGRRSLGFGSALVAKTYTDPSTDLDAKNLTSSVAKLIALVAAARQARMQRPA